MAQDFSKMSREDKLAVSCSLCSCCLLVYFFKPPVLKYHQGTVLSLLQLLEKDSPELFDLLEDFDVNMSETVELLQFQSRVAKDSPTFTDEASSSI